MQGIKWRLYFRAAFELMKKIIISSYRYSSLRIKHATRICLGGALCLFVSGCMDGAGFPDLSSLKLTPKTESNRSSGYETSEEEPRHIPQVVIPSEVLLDAEGNWNLVEKGREYDPAQAHLEARKQVNTKSWKTNKALAAHFEPDAKSGEDGKIRVLKLERQGSKTDRSYDEYEIAETSIAKPTTTVVEKDLVQKIADLFGASDGVPIPKAKPMRSSERSGVQVAAVATEETVKHPRMIGDVVIPPLTPKRKIVVPASVAIAPIAEKKIVVKDVAPVSEEKHVTSDDDVIIPPRKPVRGQKKPQSSSQYKTIQPRSLTVESSAVPVPNAKPKAKIKTSRNVLEKGVVSSKTVRVTKVRAGSHPDKTRVVIEVTRATNYKVAVDHIRKVLRVKISNARTTMDMKGVLSGNKLLGSYVMRSLNDGSILLEMRLKSSARIIDTMLLRPNTSSQHRIVVDLKG